MHCQILVLLAMSHFKEYALKCHNISYLICTRACKLAKSFMFYEGYGLDAGSVTTWNDLSAVLIIKQSLCASWMPAVESGGGFWVVRNGSTGAVKSERDLG